MSKLRKSISINEHEKAQLQDLYLRYEIPSDQYADRPDDLRDFIDEWNAVSGRNDAAEDVMHYIITQRKQKKWVRFDSDHKPAPAHQSLTPEETEVLVEIFEEHVLPLDNCSDVLAYDKEISDLVAKEFAHRTGRRIPGHRLCGKLTALRKRGLTPKVGKRAQDEGIGFSDMSEVG